MVPAVALPFGRVEGLDSGLGRPDWDGPIQCLNRLTRGACLLAGVLALAGRRLGVVVQDLTTYLTGQYGFFVDVLGAAPVLAAVGYALGVPYGAGTRRGARLFGTV